MESLVQLLGPLHPPLIHFPIVCSILAAGACAAYPLSRRAWLLEAAAWLWILTLLSALACAVTGYCFSLSLGLVDHFSTLPPETVRHGLLRDHVLWAAGAFLAAILLSVAAMATLQKKPWPFVLQLVPAFAAALLFGLAGHHGGEMVYGGEEIKAELPGAGASLLQKAAGYRENLVLMNIKPWNSRTHGHRWVNTYVSREAAAAFQNGSPLPVGSLVVKESYEDEGGKISKSPGPLYVMSKGSPADAPETGGWQFAFNDENPAPGNPEKLLGPARWIPGDLHLASCIRCHAHFKSTDFLGGIPDGLERP